MRLILAIYYIGLFVWLSTTLVFFYTAKLIQYHFHLTPASSTQGLIATLAVLFGLIGVVFYGSLVQEKYK